MAHVLQCDQCGLGEPVIGGDTGGFHSIPRDWYTVRHGGTAFYCSQRCAILALGGSWPSGSPAESPDTRAIPWPPSDELVERVAKAIHDRRCQCRITTHWPAWLDEARAVLDAIFGEAVTDV